MAVSKLSANVTLHGVGLPVGVPVAVPVAVGVAVAVAVGVAVGVFVGVPQVPPPVNTSANALSEPVSPAALSLTFSTHVPFALSPSKADRGLFGVNVPVMPSEHAFSMGDEPSSSSTVLM